MLCLHNVDQEILNFKVYSRTRYRCDQSDKVFHKDNTGAELRRTIKYCLFKHEFDAGDTENR